MTQDSAIQSTGFEAGPKEGPVAEPLSGQEKNDPTQPANRKAERGVEEERGDSSEVQEGVCSESGQQRALQNLMRSGLVQRSNGLVKGCVLRRQADGVGGWPQPLTQL